MFQKPFKTKAQTILRGSDKKKLQQRVKEQLQIEQVFTNKEEVKKVKIFSNKGESGFVYCFRENPMLFENQDKIFPTVYLLWENCKAIPRLKTYSNVIKILIGGADLMFPGVVVTESEDYHTNEFSAGDVVSITTTASGWPLAVGTSLISSQTVLQAEERSGKAVKVEHVFGDYLWQMGSKTSPPKVENEEEDNATLEEALNNMEVVEEEKNESEEEEVVELTAEEKVQQALMEKEEMNQLLNSCFMHALKTKLKDKDLPVLASTFYRNSVLPCCPSDKNLEVKKTSYKKFGVFLKSKVEEGVISVKEMSKGSEGITGVDRNCEAYRSFSTALHRQQQPTADEKETVEATTEMQFGVLVHNAYSPPEITTLYRVTSLLHPILQPFGVRKNTSLSMSEIRKHVTDYVTMNELKRDELMVRLDPYLHRATCDNNEGHIDQLPWQALFKRLMGKLPTDHQLKFEGIAPIIGKGEAPNIDISVAKRINNKHVTIVKNLERFMIEPQNFASQIKKLAQASVVISSELPETAKNNSLTVQIQGNQVRNVEKVLVETYKLPRKHIKGLEAAVKEKKKNKR